MISHDDPFLRKYIKLDFKARECYTYIHAYIHFFVETGENHVNFSVAEVTLTRGTSRSVLRT